MTRVVAATDGSRRAIRGADITSGWAWVTNDGRFGAGVFDSASILATEVYAILHLVAVHAMSADEIHVGCDSKQAISIIRRVHNGSLATDEAAHSLGLKSGRALRKFSRLHKYHGTLTLQWVPGHHGHLLNETADRLAVATRRASESGSSIEVRDLVQNSIMDDFRAHLVLPSN